MFSKLRSVWVREDGTYALENAPVLILVLTVVGVLSTYIVSTTRDDTPAVFPYISNAGGLPPQSGVLTLTLSLVALHLVPVMVIRHRIVVFENHDRSSGDVTLKRVYSAKIAWWNRWSLVPATMSLCGLLVLAAFPVHDVLAAHNTGAATCFLCGLVYQVMQTRVSYIAMTLRRAAAAASPTPEHHRQAYRSHLHCGLELWQWRIVTSITCLMGLATLFVGAAVAKVTISDEDKKLMHDSMKGYRSEYGGYAAHVASTFGEWVAVVAFMSFFLTFRPSFRAVTFRPDFVFARASSSSSTTTDPSREQCRACAAPIDIVANGASGHAHPTTSSSSSSSTEAPSPSMEPFDVEAVPVSKSAGSETLASSLM